MMPPPEALLQARVASLRGREGAEQELERICRALCGAQCMAELERVCCAIGEDYVYFRINHPSINTPPHPPHPIQCKTPT
jgi:hypothetical protein